MLKHSLCAQAFLDDLGKDINDRIKKQGVEFTWHEATDPSSGSSDGTQKLDMPETIEQMQSKTFQASKLGVKKGAYVAFKKDEEMRMWRIDKIDNEVATIVERIDGDDGTTQEVSLGSLLSEWRVHKGKVTDRIPGWSAGSPSPMESEAWALECAKSTVNLGIRSVYEAHEGNHEFIELLQNPAIVRVTKTFKPGALKLVAASMRIDKKSSSGSIAIGKIMKFDLWICSQFSLPVNNNTGEKNKSPWVVPFWYVPIVPKGGNMHIEFESVNVHGITVPVPVMRNTVELKTGDKLMVAKSVRDALQKAMPENPKRASQKAMPEKPKRARKS